jgi:hypothetical protein
VVDDPDDPTDPRRAPPPGGEPTPLDRTEVLEVIPRDGIEREELVGLIDGNRNRVDSALRELRESDEVRIERDRIYRL